MDAMIELGLGKQDLVGCYLEHNPRLLGSPSTELSRGWDGGISPKGLPMVIHCLAEQKQ